MCSYLLCYLCKTDPNYTCLIAALDYLNVFRWKVFSLSVHVSVELSTAMVLKWVLAVSWSCSSLRPCAELCSDSSAKCCVWYAVWPFKVDSSCHQNVCVSSATLGNVIFASNFFCLNTFFLYLFPSLFNFFPSSLLFPFLSWPWCSEASMMKARIGVICCILSYLYYY